MSPKRRNTSLLALAVLAFMLAAYLAFINRAKSDPHMMPHHPLQDMLLHEKFYSTWNRHTSGSCCNNSDCYPTKAVFDDALGLWRAERREDHKMLIIPKSVYDPEHPERERESPDGQSHLCAPAPSVSQLQLRWDSASGGYVLAPGNRMEVYCFTPGEGH